MSLLAVHLFLLARLFPAGPHWERGYEHLAWTSLPGALAIVLFGMHRRATDRQGAAVVAIDLKGDPQLRASLAALAARHERVASTWTLENQAAAMAGSA